ncbi:MAG: YcaO-like family protein [Alphaproteobacteria bacterium]|nr:YcaO-like family protein [Alphaproteobacteria bacterium]
MTGSPIAGLLGKPLPKRFCRGTHRSIDPEETLARVRPHIARMGITRIGNITGLDRIGIPVAVAVRPNSRSISVSQGKGLTLSHALASAAMEAVEGFHAEEVVPSRKASYAELVRHVAVVEPDSLCSTGKAFDPEASIDWIDGYDLLRGAPCCLPAEIVHCDYTRRFDGFFLAGSNGLASGNEPVEALTAAICELIERDGIAMWYAKGVVRQARQRLDLSSVDDPDCQVLLALYDRARIAVRVWDLAGDLGVAAFLCQIRDASPGDPRWLRRFQGAGCHPDRGIALARALTEAAQTRLTYIAGIRDDLLPAKYKEPQDAAIADALIDAVSSESDPVRFSDCPQFASGDLAADLRWLIGQVRACDLKRLIAVALTQPDIDIPVFRVVIPALEGDPRHPLYLPGPRAQRAAIA